MFIFFQSLSLILYLPLLPTLFAISVSITMFVTDIWKVEIQNRHIQVMWIW